MTNYSEFFPNGTAAAVQLDRILLTDGKKAMSDWLSSHLVLCASELDADAFLGWQMIVPKKGVISVQLFGSASVSASDLEWIAETTGHTCKIKRSGQSAVFADELYEFSLPISAQSGASCTIGFGASLTTPSYGNVSELPMHYGANFESLVEALRESGGMLRVTVGVADAASQQCCRDAVLKAYSYTEPSAAEYIGTPVRLRVLLRLPSAPSMRLRTVLHESVREAKLHRLGAMTQSDIAAVWDAPLQYAPTLPDYAARLLMTEPILHQPVIGLDICRETAKKYPANHINPKDKKAVTLGRATDITGIRRNVTVGEIDLRRHYQIVGQTGTGKSTLLASIILSAIKQGHGLTFFDPHGTTIDTVLHAIPKQYAERVRVVRISDADNPVPLNIWDSGDPVQEERNIADLCELFADIFNPPREVFVGPRYERWLATFAKASIALLGKRASLESIAVLSQSQEKMKKLCKAIENASPEVAEMIWQEYCMDDSREFHLNLGWYLSKFQRLTSIEQLRKTLGAGANALNFADTIDTDTVTLIDLASPVIGTQAARIVGTIIMMKLWNAVLTRKERDRTHMVIVDEAALFQTNPMPKMLAESRKFGLSMVLCHQHTGQLSDEIRDALEANSANFSAFRLSPKDAVRAAIRFDDDAMGTYLARQDAYQALTTLSINGRQTAPFTLETVPPKKQKDGEAIAAMIEKRSRETLVEPYRSLRALKPSEILYYLDHPEKLVKPEWLYTWIRKREEMKSAV